MSVYILDTETTGIVDPVPVSVAWVAIDALMLVEAEFDRYYKPNGKKISFGAMATHHIIESDLADAPHFSEFSLPSDAHFLVGHSADYDWAAIGKPDVKRICTLALSRSLWPDLDSHTLVALLYALTDPEEHNDLRDRVRGAHDARTDCYLTMDLLSHIIKKLGIRLPIDFNELWEISERARIPTVLAFGKYKGTPISKVPADYKRWLLNQPDLDPYLVQALQSGRG